MFQIIFLLSAPVFGETYSTKNPHITPSSKGAVHYSTRDMGGKTQDISADALTEEDCKQLIINAKANSNVDYKAGAADLPGSPATKDYNLGDEVHIDLQGKFREYAPSFPAPAPGKKDFIAPVLRDSDVGIGNIEVHKDGKMWINGVPTFDEDQAKLEEACRAKFPNL